MNVLMIGRNLAMMEMGAAPIKDAGHSVTATLNDSEAMEKLQSGTFPALVFGMAVEQSARTTIKKFIADQKLQIIVLEPMSPMDLPDILQALQEAK
jgi:CheY-like chemotaxis protein